MAPPARQPYSRAEFAGALVANATAKPFNIALLIGTMGAGVLVGGSVAVALLAALAVYAIAVARTFLRMPSGWGAGTCVRCATSWARSRRG